VKSSLISLLLDGNPITEGTLLLYRWVDDRVYWLRVVSISPPSPAPSSLSPPVYIIRQTTSLTFQLSRKEEIGCMRGKEGDISSWLDHISGQFAVERDTLSPLLQKISQTLFSSPKDTPRSPSSPASLFYGVAGCGKTKLAKCIASTSGVQWSYVSCSEIFKSSKKKKKVTTEKM
jgi:hypothetical protein